MSMWVREEPLSASALRACYSQLEKGGGAEINAVSFMSQGNQELPQQQPCLECSISKGVSGQGEGWEKARPKEIWGKRMFVLVLKQESASFVEVRFRKYNSRRLGCEKLTFRNQIGIHKRTGIMRSSLFLESCLLTADSQTGPPGPPDYSCH